MSAIDIDVTADPPADFVAFAAALRFGAGAARYRRVNLAGQIARFADPRFVVAREAGRVVGGYAIDFRTVRHRDALVPGVYRALLGVDPDRRGRGTGRALVDAARALIDAHAARTGEAVLSWGCIDASNAASLDLLGRVGAVDVGGLASWLLYRQAPRESLPVDIVDGARETSVRHGHAHALEASLRDCTFADLTAPSSRSDRDRDVGTVHAVLEGERVVLAARVAPTVLAFDTLGPVNDALVRRLVMPFGFARRRFDPRAFRYLSLSDIVMVPDAERLWPRFVSTLAARFGAHHALVTLDPSRELWRRLRKASGRRAGRRAGTTGAANLRVLARWHGIDDGTSGTGRDDPPDATGSIALHPVDV